MKVLTDKTPRQNLVIELTPDEQDALFAVTGALSGSGGVRDVTDNLYDILQKFGANEKKYELRGYLNVNVGPSK